MPGGDLREWQLGGGGGGGGGKVAAEEEGEGVGGAHASIAFQLLVEAMFPENKALVLLMKPQIQSHLLFC